MPETKILETAKNNKIAIKKKEKVHEKGRKLEYNNRPKRKRKK